jgi:hypothetical protein
MTFVHLARPCAAALAAAALLVITEPLRAAGPQTERRYLSGQGPDDAVPWEFRVTGGRRAGEWTTLPVPSNWELHGFGTYNYGQEPDKADERGQYRLRFAVPPEWKGRRIRLVFDGVMTDAAVKLNGRAAGPVHQGGFTRFRHDITSLVKLGAGAENENLLEVEVAKVSADAQTERAERGGDYWVFGGIYRPVWLEAVPAHAIEHVAIDARADGSFTADVTLGAMPGPTRHEAVAIVPERIEAQILTAAGEPVGGVFTAKIPLGGTGRLRVAGRIDAPQLWSAETPHLYQLRLSRIRDSVTTHTITQRFGFRTFEVREGEGLFLNGTRILLKGVNRHSFRPETGRALSRRDCEADVRLIREMNMNAVRMSHYPPDEAFLDACDELGLYVLNELSGWQHPHGTAIGRLLVREMVERDVNHPSILFWNNGNERGWNRDLDGDFALYDPQRRPVLHPSDPYGGFFTMHYTSFDEHAKRLQGPSLVMPTEILHAMYDGGAGAGLDDYWREVEGSRFGAGAFIWVLADEGVVRTDQNGRIDVFSTFAPDGIVGPRHQKEASFHTIRDVWSPVQIAAPRLDEAFDGRLSVRNAYDFTPLSLCRFTWRLVRFGEREETIAEGATPGPPIAPRTRGTLALALPANWRSADALALTALDPRGAALWTWTWPTSGFTGRSEATTAARGTVPPKVENAPDAVRLVGGDVVASFDRATGMLRSVRRGANTFALTDGPRLAFARPVSAGPIEWLPMRPADAAALTRHLASPRTASVIEAELENVRGVPHIGLMLEVSPDGTTWTTIFDGTRRPTDGTRYDIPPQRVAAVRISKLRRSDGRPAALKTLRAGHAPVRFPVETPEKPSVTTGMTEPARAAGSNARGGRCGPTARCNSSMPTRWRATSCITGSPSNTGKRP